MQECHFPRSTILYSQSAFLFKQHECKSRHLGESISSSPRQANEEECEHRHCKSDFEGNHATSSPQLGAINHKGLLECSQCGFETKKASHMKQHLATHTDKVFFGTYRIAVNMITLGYYILSFCMLSSYIWCTRLVLRRVTSLEVLVTHGFVLDSC